MARDMIVVGAGDYWKNLVMPTLGHLRESDLVNNVTTVDLKRVDSLQDAGHVVRKVDEPLHEIVDRIGYERPIVVLAHDNNLHTSDAVDVIRNSRNSPSLLIEKPYAVDREQLSCMRGLVQDNSGDVALLEYYLTMKCAPLLLFGGSVKSNSFYFEDNGILKMGKNGSKLKDFESGFAESVGKPLFIVSDVLEGEGSFGTIAHRNLSLVDNERGGGMIQDLGLHAISPLMGLSQHLGRITRDSITDVRVASCREYLAFARDHLPNKRIGESYAEIDLKTDAGVPVRVSLGKYVQAGENQRRIVIAGTRGVVLYDMTNNLLALQRTDRIGDVTPLIEADKKGVPKYLAVLQAGIEQVNGNNPFNFDPVDTALCAQDIVLEALAKEPSRMEKYDQGAVHDAIF